MSAFITVNREKCIGCGMCQRNCPKSAIQVIDKKASISFECVACQVCVKVCPVGALSVAEAPKEQGFVTCGSCPVHCRIREGKTGGCKRFRCVNGELKRVIPLYTVDKSSIKMDHETMLPDKPLITGIGSGTNLQKMPARIVAMDNVDGVDVVTAVTEAVLSFSGVRVILETEAEVGAEGSAIRRDKKIVGYVTSSWAGERTLSIGGVTLVKGKDGFIAASTVVELLDGKTVMLQVDNGPVLTLTKGQPPVINGEVTSPTDKVDLVYVGGVGGGVMGALRYDEAPSIRAAIHEGRILVTSGGRQVHLMPGGNAIIEVDATDMPTGAFAYEPTPATSMPVEFTMSKETYFKECSYHDAIVPLEDVLEKYPHVMIQGGREQF